MLYDAAILEDVKFHDRLCSREKYMCFFYIIRIAMITVIRLLLEQVHCMNVLWNTTIALWQTIQNPFHQRKEEKDDDRWKQTVVEKRTGGFHSHFTRR